MPNCTPHPTPVAQWTKFWTGLAQSSGGSRRRTSVKTHFPTRPGADASAQSSSVLENSQNRNPSFPPSDLYCLYRRRSIAVVPAAPASAPAETPRNPFQLRSRPIVLLLLRDLASKGSRLNQRGCASRSTWSLERLTALQRFPRCATGNSVAALDRLSALM